MAVRNYKLIEFPIKRSFKEMSEKEAEKFLKWFVKSIPGRIEIFKKTAQNTGYDPRKLNFSPESLKYLGEWFAKRITSRKLTKNEIEKIESGIPGHLKPHVDIPKVDLSKETLSLCYDIGMYLGETFRKNVKGLKWDFIKKPKNDIDYHKPVLVGGKIPVNPIHLVKVFATGLLDKTYSSHRLREVYDSNIEYYFTKESKK